MLTRGLLARLKAQSGTVAETEHFLMSALPLVQAEPATAAWFALRFGKREYGMFDAFAGEAGRLAHLEGPTATSLVAQTAKLFEQPPEMETVDIIASKVPETLSRHSITCGLLLGFQARDGHEKDVEQFLRDAQSTVNDEPGTTAWFALRWPQGRYGIFDVFPDHEARMVHVTGHVPRELARHAFKLVGGLPSMDMLDVLASHVAERVTEVGLGVD